MLTLRRGPWHIKPKQHPSEMRTEASMTPNTARPALGALIFFAVAFSLATYFTFAAVQGDYGVFRRAEISVAVNNLETELANLQAEIAKMENLTKRLSDTYLDLDLLDQQARDVLGLLRSDEIVVE
jgi:cell division protein FtsB